MTDTSTIRMNAAAVDALTAALAPAKAVLALVIADGEDHAGFSMSHPIICDALSGIDRHLDDAAAILARAAIEGRAEREADVSHD